MAIANEVVAELETLARVYKDGSVERCQAPIRLSHRRLQDPETGVSSKHITISADHPISARIYLPNLSDASRQKLRVAAVSIEYRLAPEHPLPIAFDDCWARLQWVATHSGPNVITEEPRLSCADFEQLYLDGDRAGASLAHYVVMRAGKECLPNNVKISRAFYTHPDTRGPSLAGLGCSKLLVSVSEKDILWSRGISFYNAVKESGWKGEAELIEVEGESHAFHIVNYESESAKKFRVRLASFLK
ncbi:hypothetical protein SLE2022_171520 [Rubroshorea leprosula]